MAEKEGICLKKVHLFVESGRLERGEQEEGGNPRKVIPIRWDSEGLCFCRRDVEDVVPYEGQRYLSEQGSFEEAGKEDGRNISAIFVRIRWYSVIFFASLRDVEGVVPYEVKDFAYGLTPSGNREKAMISHFRSVFDGRHPIFNDRMGGEKSRCQRVLSAEWRW